MLLRSMLVFFFILWSGAASAATILIWGDSLSAGYGLRPHEAWPALLQTRLQDKGFRHTVINGSVSGETSAGGLSRLPKALDHHKPDILVLELGANDGLRGLPPKLMAENLGAMIDTARKAGSRVLLVGMQMPPNYGEAYNIRFQQAYTATAARYEVPLVRFLLDGFAARREMFQADGIHPTADAQPLILDTVWKSLAPLLEQRTAKAGP